MPVIKNTILYSLFIVSSMNFSLYCQDANIQDNDDLMLIFDNSSDDDVHPIEDVDIAGLMLEIQNHVDTLELDFPMKSDSITIDFEQLLPEEKNIQLQDSPELDPITLPITAIDNNYNFVSIDDCDDEQCQENCILPISKDQLEELLDSECKQIQEDLSCDEQIHDDCITITVDCLDIKMSCENGIALQVQEHKVASNDVVVAIELDDDEDIIPVPHDLINYVKKANKQKKKLEKLERKEKANVYKKSKKRNR